MLDSIATCRSVELFSLPQRTTSISSKAVEFVRIRDIEWTEIDVV